MEEAHHPIHSYLRIRKRFPAVWCSGCGIGIVMGAFIRAVQRLEMDKDKVVMVSGIGCSSRMPVYLDFNTLHTTHGRALPFATGIKFARPDLTVIVVMGDGDALAIGGNHFIHTCRRNIDLTAIVINNNTYSMTGGQISPTTPEGSLTATTPYGSYQPPFDVCELGKAAGATYVARGTTYHSVALDRMIEKGIRHRGLSLVEAVTHCHTIFGRQNRLGNPVEMLHWQRDHAVSKRAARKMSREELEGKFLTGILLEKDSLEFIERYERQVEYAQGMVGMSGAPREKAAPACQIPASQTCPEPDEDQVGEEASTEAGATQESES